MSSLKTALSQDESLLAVVSSKSNNRFLTIPLYQVNSQQIQCTLTCPFDQKEVINQLVICGNEYLCVLLSSSRVVVFNVTRGVVQTTVQVDDDKFHIHNIFASTSLTLSLLVVSTENNKAYIHVHDVDGGKCIRKVKCGTIKVAAVYKDELVAVVTHHKKKPRIKLISLKDGSKVAKHKLKQPSDETMLLQFSQDGKHLVASSFSGQAEIFSRSDKKQTRISIPHKATKIQLQSANKDEYTLLVENATTHQASLQYGTATQQSTAIAFQQMRESASIKSCGFHLLRNDSILTVAMVNHEEKDNQVCAIRQARYRKESITDSQIKINLFPEQQEQDTTTDTGSLKRKQDAAVLGPGQAGTEAQAVEGPLSKKPKQQQQQQEEEEDVSIAQRLERLKQEMLKDESDTEKQKQQQEFQPKRATTESLSKLLQQALQSGDDAMLELALTVRDKKVMQQTLAGLDNDKLLETLFTKLVERFATKPTRAQDLAAWLQLILMNPHPMPPRLMVPLRNLIQERVESFPHLLQLQGRLSLL